MFDNKIFIIFIRMFDNIEPLRFFILIFFNKNLKIL